MSLRDPLTIHALIAAALSLAMIASALIADFLARRRRIRARLVMLQHHYYAGPEKCRCEKARAA